MPHFTTFPGAAKRDSQTDAQPSQQQATLPRLCNIRRQSVNGRQWLPKLCPSRMQVAAGRASVHESRMNPAARRSRSRRCIQWRPTLPSRVNPRHTSSNGNIGCCASLFPKRLTWCRQENPATTTFSSRDAAKSSRGFQLRS